MVNLTSDCWQCIFKYIKANDLIKIMAISKQIRDLLYNVVFPIRMLEIINRKYINSMEDLLSRFKEITFKQAEYFENDDMSNSCIFRFYGVCMSNIPINCKSLTLIHPKDNPEYICVCIPQLSYFHNLKYLQLSNYSFKNDIPIIFSTLNNLKILRLISCKNIDLECIYSVKNTLKSLTLVICDFITNNDIPILDMSLFDPSMKVLNIVYCNIIVINIELLINLKHLDLSYYDIYQTIDVSMFKNLKILYTNLKYVVGLKNLENLTDLALTNYNSPNDKDLHFNVKLKFLCCKTLSDDSNKILESLTHLNILTPQTGIIKEMNNLKVLVLRRSQYNLNDICTIGNFPNLTRLIIHHKQNISYNCDKICIRGSYPNIKTLKLNSEITLFDNLI